MYKNYIWDFDGTLFDTYPVMVRTMIKSLEFFGYKEDEVVICSYIKNSMEALTNYLDRTYNNSDEIISMYKKNINLTGINEFEPFEEIVEVCKLIVRKGGSNHLLTHRGNSSVLLLEKFDILSSFSELITKNSGFARKPNPESILFLIEKYNLDPKETIMIGDRELDLLAGKNAGVSTCYFRQNDAPEIEVADYVISDFKELQEFIDVAD